MMSSTPLFRVLEVRRERGGRTASVAAKRFAVAAKDWALLFAARRLRGEFIDFAERNFRRLSQEVKEFSQVARLLLTRS